MRGGALSAQQSLYAHEGPNLELEVWFEGSMLCLYEPLNTQKVSSSYLSPLLVHRFLKIGHKMPNTSIFTFAVKSAIEKSLPMFEKLIRTPSFFKVEVGNLAWIDSIHIYEKSIRKVWVGSTINGLQLVQGGLGAQRPPPP